MEGAFQIDSNIQNKPVFKKADNCCVSNYRQVSPVTDFSIRSNKTVNEFFNSKRTLQGEKFEFRKGLLTKPHTASQMKCCAPKNKMSVSCSVTLPEHLIV
jgi:hypothetical protein